MLKIFISQPMNGLTLEQIKNDREKCINIIDKYLSKNEYYILDNIREDEINIANNMKNSRVYMLGNSISLLGNADLVIFLKGWEDSLGCSVEDFVCEEYDIKRIRSLFHLNIYLSRYKKKLNKPNKKSKSRRDESGK